MGCPGTPVISWAWGPQVSLMSSGSLVTRVPLFPRVPKYVKLVSYGNIEVGMYEEVKLASYGEEEGGDT